MADFNTLNLQMNLWELSPGLVILIMAGLGLMRARRKVRLNQGRAYGQKQRNERKKISLPILINTPVTHEFSINTYDISLTGAFFSYEDLKSSMSFTSLIGRRTGIKVGDLIDIKIYIGRFSQLRCQAKVVRYNFSDDSMPPKGIAIEFINLSHRKKKILENILETQDYSQAS